MEHPSIKAIDKVSVARICSGQVITDLATAVKELVENSLDAGAKHVEVKLKEFGLDLIEVSDNGSGVSPSNYEGLALKYHTSKLSTFSDLSGVKSFGFRGEALSSLCELAGSFSVTTRATGESVGVKLTYGRNGKLLGKETAPRQVGTTISISNMFEPLPVRRGEFRRNIKKQYNRLLRGMQSYALISLGVRITVTNTKAKGGKQTLIGTQYNNKLDDNVTNVFGAKFLSTLSAVDICLGEKGTEEKSQPGDACVSPPGGQDAADRAATKATVSERRIWGMVSKAGEGVGRADNDRQFMYLNGRPVDLPKFTRAVSEVWRAYEMKQKPAFILDLRLPPGSFDVNVTPDKREIFMTGEAEVVDGLKKALHELWSPSRYTIPVNQGQLVQARLTDGPFTLQDSPTTKSPPTTALKGTSRIGIVSPEPLEDLVATDVPLVDQDEVMPVSGRRKKARASQGAADGDVTEEPRETRIEASAHGTGVGQRGGEGCNAKGDFDANGSDMAKAPKRSLEPAQSAATAASAVSGEVLGSSKDRDEQLSQKSPTPKRRCLERNGEGKDRAGTPTVEGIEADAAQDSAVGERRREKRVETPSKGGVGLGSQDKGEGATGTGGNPLGKNATSNGIDDITASPSEATGAPSANARVGAAPGASLSFDMQSILGGCRRASRLKRERDTQNATAHSFSGKLSGGGAEHQDSKAAERAFSRVLNKEHFTQMRVVGQFNLGFMICLLGSDLFILDQHACDEKYNFEVLQQTTTIHQQPLVRPLPLETSASEEMTIIDNMALFEKNGFRFAVDDDQPTTKKLKIVAVPFSKGTQFGVDDVHELASIVADNNSPGEVVRLPKARAMFASRACRSSIMIGKALDKGQMKRVVAKMATIEQPWNCPHGRPTMRHLADVSKSLRAAAGLHALLEG